MERGAYKRKPFFSAAKKFASFDVFSPKKIILDGIKSRLENSGVTKIILNFSCDNDNYKIMVTNINNESMKIDVTEDEITTIKKIFIKKVVNAWNMHYDDNEPKSVIIQVDLQSTTLDLFIENYKGEVLKFDY